LIRRAEGRVGFFCDVRTLQLFANQFTVGFEDEAPASLEPDRKCSEHFQYSLKRIRCSVMAGLVLAGT
jgi:hypothetical protein